MKMSCWEVLCRTRKYLPKLVDDTDRYTKRSMIICNLPEFYDNRVATFHCLQDAMYESGYYSRKEILPAIKEIITFLQPACYKLPDKYFKDVRSACWKLLRGMLEIWS